MSTHQGSDTGRLRSIARRAMLERGLLPEFSAAVTNETNAIVDGPYEPNAAVRDLRHLLWASIDNDDSRDLDQLSVCRPAVDGAVQILVAVADVDGIVHRASAIDGHAEANTTSVYTAAQMFPMLPEKLSTDLTSLGQGQDRLAIVIEMLVGEDGVVTKSDVYRAVVCNRAKLAYNAVAAWIDGTASEPRGITAVAGLDEQLRTQDRVAQAMRALRHQHGALSLETIETRAVFDGDVLSDLRPDQPNRAKQLIENLMIAANGATARYLEAKGLPSLRRVLHSPERWQRIVDLAAESGERLPSEANALALDEFLASRRRSDPAGFADLSLSVVKLLGRGRYAVQRPGETVEGHFGLAVHDYTHSTAPNRRFPDLVTQRLLKAAIAGQPMPYSTEQLQALARHCTEQEDNAAKVERQVRKSAAALLLESRIGQRFDGMVTGASGKGTWVRISHPLVEGRIVNGFEGLDVGDRVRVKLVRTDVEHGFIDFVRDRA
ncbi:MAG: rnb [Betaproteobacteria bacterium]|nr:rnb [Betaproteobacteria bacterium]